MAYGTSPTKRRRRTRSAMTNLHSDFVEIVAEGTPMTVRQVYDQAVTRGLIDKTEQSENSERQALRMIGQQLRDEEAEGDDGRA